MLELLEYNVGLSSKMIRLLSVDNMMEIHLTLIKDLNIENRDLGTPNEDNLIQSLK